MNAAPRRREPGEIVFAGLMLAGSLFLFREAHAIAGFSSVSSAGVFPLFATGLMIVTALVILARTWRIPPAGDDGEDLAAFRRRVLPADLLVFAGMTGLYAVALAPLGFLVASFLFLAGAIFWLSARRIGVALVVAAVTLAAIYVVFRLGFHVVLPPGSLFR